MKINCFSFLLFFPLFIQIALKQWVYIERFCAYNKKKYRKFPEILGKKVGYPVHTMELMKILQVLFHLKRIIILAHLNLQLVFRSNELINFFIFF